MKIQKNNKYQLTSETKTHWTGTTLFRIKALKTFGNVTKDDLGGFIGALKNLDENGNAWVYGNAQVYGDARVYGDAQVHGDAQVNGNAWVYGDAWEFSPLQIQGTRHFVNCGSHTAIQIGCYRQTAKEWEKSFEQVGNENGYTAGQIEEYKIYIDVCKKWLALHRADFKRMNANVAEAK